MIFLLSEFGYITVTFRQEAPIIEQLYRASLDFLYSIRHISLPWSVFSVDGVRLRGPGAVSRSRNHHTALADQYTHTTGFTKKTAVVRSAR